MHSFFFFFSIHTNTIEPSVFAVLLVLLSMRTSAHDDDDDYDDYDCNGWFFFIIS